MLRCTCAFLLFGLTVALSMQAELPSASGQDKKDKEKKKVEKAQPKLVEGAEDLSRVLPVFDPGNHTQPISAMGFTKDKSKLISVGRDFTVQIWDTHTGERLDILRLPGYGREKGFDAGHWDVGAVSADGNRVAVGGEFKYLKSEVQANFGPTRLVVVDIPKRLVRRVVIAGNFGSVKALAFSPDGDSLAVVRDAGKKSDLFVVAGLTARMAKANPLIRSQDCPQVAMPHMKAAQALAFSPDGKQLLAGGDDSLVTLWDIPAGNLPKPALAKEIKVVGATSSFSWSPGGKQFVRAALGANVPNLDGGIEVWNPDGTQAKTWKLADLRRAVPRYGHIGGVWHLNASSVYFVGDGFVEKGEPTGTFSAILNLETGESKRLTASLEGFRIAPAGAASADGSLVAVSTHGSTNISIGEPADAPVRVTCGNSAPVPGMVGWSKDAAAPGFAWSSARRMGQKRLPTDALRFAFDLAKVEPVGTVKGTDYDSARFEVGDWTMTTRGTPAKEGEIKGGVILNHKGQPVAGFGENGPAKTLIPNGGNPPMVCVSSVYTGKVSLFRGDGTRMSELLPDRLKVWDIASSPDGRFLISTTGTSRLIVHKTDGSRYPLFSFALVNGEWVLWTPEGYYAASPGGDRMLGLAISNSADEFVEFHPAAKFAKKLRRPDIIKLAVEKGSVEAALASLNAKADDLNEISPPKAELTLVRQDGNRFVFKARATSTVKEKPVIAMSLMVDGKTRARHEVEKGKPAEVEWDVTLAGGYREVKVMVRTEDASATSDPITVNAPKELGQQPTLYRVCIGINKYDDKGLELKRAAADADAVFAALEANCVGSYNRFGAAKGVKLIDQEATRDAVLKALNATRKAAKPDDLVVVFFAGHGFKGGKDDPDYYLATKEANLNKLKGTALSGEDLRKALSQWECKVLLILDACHSAKAAKAFRPATDALTTSMTDDAVEVTVMAAAMAHETAGAAEENGYFTEALLKALKVDPGIRFNAKDRQLYTSHIYSFVFDEVINATNGAQHPFLNPPQGHPPLPVREVHKK